MSRGCVHLPGRPPQFSLFFPISATLKGFCFGDLAIFFARFIGIYHSEMRLFRRSCKTRFRISDQMNARNCASASPSVWGSSCARTAKLRLYGLLGAFSFHGIKDRRLNGIKVQRFKYKRRTFLIRLSVAAGVRAYALDLKRFFRKINKPNFYVHSTNINTVQIALFINSLIIFFTGYPVHKHF